MSVTRRGLDDEAGAALIVALLIALLLGAIGAVLVALANTESALSAAYRHVHEAMNGAEAGAELALHDLAAIGDWSAVVAVPPANRTARFVDRTMFPTAPNGQTLDLAALTANRQRESDARDGPGLFGADSPQWRLFAYARLSDLLPRSEPVFPVYLVVWVADDGVDGDGDPAADANGIILIRSEAFGSGGARRVIEAAVGRAENQSIRLLSWREARS
jgi:hypothetical protein